MMFECSPKEFREAYLKAFDGDKEKLDTFIKRKYHRSVMNTKSGILRRRPSLNRSSPIDWLTSFPTLTSRKAERHNVPELYDTRLPARVCRSKERAKSWLEQVRLFLNSHNS